jgi:hypothetical protein
LCVAQGRCTDFPPCAAEAEARALWEQKQSAKKAAMSLLGSAYFDEEEEEDGELWLMIH